MKHDASAPSDGSAPLTKPVVPDGGGSVWWGAAVNPFDETSSEHENNIRGLEARVGRTLGVTMHYFGWNEADASISSAPLTATNVMSDQSIAGDLTLGRTPFIAWRCGQNMTDIASGLYDSTIIAAAEAVKSIRKPVFLRWFYEWNLLRAGTPPSGTPNDGDYEGCFTTQCTPGTGAGSCTEAEIESQATEFKNAWDHIWTVFQNDGATNAAWVWVVAGAPSNVTPDMPRFLPAHVDWTGIDCYDKTSAEKSPEQAGFENCYGAAYDTMCNGSKDAGLRGLPCFFAESGENGYPNRDAGVSAVCGDSGAALCTQAQWFDDARRLMTATGRFSNAKGLCYSDQSTSLKTYPQTNWQLDNGSDAGGPATNAFAAMGASPRFASVP